MSATSLDRSPLSRPAIMEFPTAVRATVPAMIVLGCAVLAGAAPIGVSIVAVFLFAGPHNWLEARYFLTRMPARWGPLASYFSLGIGGTLVLGGMFAAMPWLAGEHSQTGLWLVAVWNTLLTVWIVSLALLRSGQNPRRDWRLVVGGYQHGDGSRGLQARAIHHRVVECLRGSLTRFQVQKRIAHHIDNTLSVDRDGCRSQQTGRVER